MAEYSGGRGVRSTMTRTEEEAGTGVDDSEAKRESVPVDWNLELGIWDRGIGQVVLDLGLDMMGVRVESGCGNVAFEFPSEQIIKSIPIAEIKLWFGLT